MNERLAICVPTYGRPEIIEELMNQMLPLYDKQGIDLYIYDSNEDDSTRQIVKHNQKIYANLYYVPIDSSVPSNTKVYMIYQQYGLTKSYDYIWVMGDALRVSEYVVEQIPLMLRENIDLLIIQNTSPEQVQIHMDRFELFRNYAWWLTLYGTAIVNVKSMLEDVEWEYLTEKYMTSQSIYFSHTALFFEQFAKKESLKVLSWAVVGRRNFWNSAFKKESGWIEDFFPVVFGAWPSMIRKLPKVYNHDKKEAMAMMGTHSALLLYSNLCLLRTRNVYKLSIYLKYYLKWSQFCSLPHRKLFQLAITRKQNVSKLRLKDLRRFCAHYQDIYVYGCGKIAKEYAQMLEQLQIPVAGYVVSDLVQNDRTFCGCPVIQVDSPLLQQKDAGIVVALNNMNYLEIMQNPYVQAMQNRLVWLE